MIYFDNAATTKPRSCLLDDYQELLNKYFGNPASLHKVGLECSLILEKSRLAIANLLHLQKEEIIFTSGATESNNLAIKGIALGYSKRGKHLITSAVEHPSVLQTFQQLQDSFGFEVTILPVNKYGIVEPESLKRAMRKETILVSIMSVNNEIGAIMPLKELAEIAHTNPRTFFHSDITQAVGKIDLPFAELDLFSFSLHKIHGLKGSGVLGKKKNISLLPLLSGGGQEFNFRSGTNDAPKEILVAKTLRLALEEQKTNYKLVEELKDYLLLRLQEIPDITINSNDQCIPYIVNFSFLKKKASVIVEGLSNQGIMVSTISACSSKKNKVSTVLKAMGKSLQETANPLRVSFSKDNSKKEIDIFIQTLQEILQNTK